MTESNLPVPTENALSFGQTALRPQDLVVPRVKVVQQMAKEAADGLAKPGDFFNTLSGEAYGPSLRIQPIQPFMNRILLVRSERREAIDEQLESRGLDPLSEGDGLKCRSFDMVLGRGEPGLRCEEECPLSQWRRAPNGKSLPPLCTETYNVAASTELGDLIVVSFSKSAAKVGKRVFSLLRLTQAQPWSRFLDLSTHQDRNDQGTFYVPDFRVVADPPDTGQLANALHWARTLQAAGPIELDVTPDEDDVAPSRPVNPDGDGEDLPF